MKLLKNLRWIAVWTATWTMLATPVAMGQEAKRVSKSQMQSVVDELGLNKQITIGEFYQKNKALLPDRIKKEIEPFFMANKNMMMPTFEVISSKTTSGDEIPTLRVSQNGELINIQWFGEKNRLMKFQNTNLTEVDIVNFNDMFTRIAAGDEKFRKQAEPVKSNLKKTTAAIRSFKYPDVTKEQWKTMTPRDRASYVVTLRTLHADALKVLALKPALKSKAKKKKYSFIDSHPYFSALFSYQEVQAASYFTAKSCVVAGYLSTYERREDGHEVCSTSKIISSRTEDTLFGKAKEQCGPDQIPCNPAIYGAPNGKPTCLTPSVTDAEFQTATHFAGKCDTDSRLQTDTAEVAFLNDPTKTSGRYNSDNFKLPDKEREEYFKTQQGANFQKTEEYLLGLLKLKGLVGRRA